MNMFWLVIVVFVLIWILNSFLRSNQDDKKGDRQAAGGGRREGQGSRRRMTEIEQFLEEATRRRRQGPEVRQALPAEEAAPMATPLATRSTRTTGSKAGTRRQSAQVQTRRSPGDRVGERPLLAEAVLAVETPGSRIDARPAPGQRSLDSNKSAPAVQLTTTASETQFAVLTQLTAMLKTPEGLRAAVILQEVFGPPRCRKQGLR